MFLFWLYVFKSQILIYPFHDFEVILPWYLVIQKVSSLKYKVYIFLSSSWTVFFLLVCFPSSGCFPSFLVGLSCST